MKDEVKNLGNTSIKDLKESTSDIVIFGNENTWLLLSKASSKSQGWMKSTKAMEIEGQGCLVQTCTEFRTKDLTQVTACSDSVTYVHGVRIDTIVDEEGKVIERKLTALWPVDLPKTESKTVKSRD